MDAIDDVVVVTTVMVVVAVVAVAVAVHWPVPVLLLHKIQFVMCISNQQQPESIHSLSCSVSLCSIVHHLSTSVLYILLQRHQARYTAAELNRPSWPQVQTPKLVPSHCIASNQTYPFINNSPRPASPGPWHSAIPTTTPTFKWF